MNIRIQRMIALMIATAITLSANKLPKDAPAGPPKRLVLQVEKVKCIKPTTGWGEDKNEIEMSSIMIRPPNASVTKAQIWKVASTAARGKFGKGDVTPPGTKHELASFDLPTTIKSPLTYQVTLMMADRDKGGFSAYLKELVKKTQAAVDGVTQKQKKGGSKAEDVVELTADLLGQGWVVDLAKPLIKVWNRNSNDEILDPSAAQKQTVGPDFRIDGKPKTVVMSGFSGVFEVTYTWRLI